MNKRHAGQRGARAAPLLIAVGLLLAAPAARAVDPNAQEEQQAKLKKKAKVEEKRHWSADALLETHWIAVRDNQPNDDVYQVLYVRGNYDLPKVGLFTLRLDVTRRYVADEDESGFYFGDIRLYYSRSFPFKIKGHGFAVRPYFYWTFPTSRQSDYEGNISRPTLLVAASTQLPYNVTVFLRPFVRRNWHRYAEAEGGQPNTRWLWGYDTLVDWRLPWHERLSFGAAVGQYWFDQYGTREGQSQRINSYFFWETYAGYNILQKPVSLDAYLAVASGHQTVEDGVWRVKWFDRDDTEFYFSLRVAY